MTYNDEEDHLGPFGVGDSHRGRGRRFFPIIKWENVILARFQKKESFGWAVYCTNSTISSVTRHSQKKSPRLKSLELKRKFIGHLGDQNFRIRELMVELVQYPITMHSLDQELRGFGRTLSVVHHGG
jgi:hypothetical protein